jgi:hypothetical protein
MVGTITWKTKKKAKESVKDTQLARTKEGRELVPLVVGKNCYEDKVNDGKLFKAWR